MSTTATADHDDLNARLARSHGTSSSRSLRARSLRAPGAPYGGGLAQALLHAGEAMARVPFFLFKPRGRSIQDTSRELAERVIEIMNQHRAREGLPPMPKGEEGAEPTDAVVADPRYPRPDRSDLSPSKFGEEGAREGDLFAREHILPDGRPCRVEAWFFEGLTLVTAFFSTVDLVDAAPEALVHLLSAVLDLEKVPAEARKLTADEVHVIQDASGNPMYSLTFTVGVPD